MSEELKAAQARIAELEHRCGMYGLELTNEVGRRLQAERQLSALKAQEPVAWAGAIEDGVPLLVVEPQNWKATPLYAAPVSEAKAQGVVMPEPSGWVGGGLFFHDRDKALEAAAKSPCVEVYSRSQMLARRNAAPVQQVKCKTCDDNGMIGGPSFYAPDEGGEPCPDCSAHVTQVSAQDGWKHGLPPDGEICEARIPHHTADGRQMIWCEVEVIAHSIIKGAIYSWVKETGQDGSFYAPMMLSFRKLAAAPAAPAADAGLVEALEMIIEMNRQHAADQFGDAEKAEAWSCIRVAREALAAHRAKGVV